MRLARVLVVVALCVSSLIGFQGAAHAGCQEPVNDLDTCSTQDDVCAAAAKLLGWACID